MKIAFIHYHLKTGGVTTVLKQQLSAIDRRADTLVMAGDSPEVPLAADLVTIPELGYTSEYKAGFDPADVARTIIKAIYSKFSGPCDVLHIHNPTLAKNRQFIKIIKFLQKEDVNLLLQIHDFAEDGRPLVYFSEDYPADCHYAVINRRDYQILLKSGLKPEGLHLIENTVSAPQITPKPEVEGSMVLYPIRAIRRKNIGEAALLSLFMKNQQALFITLPPNSPVDIKSYRGWKTFVQAQELNVAFDKGLSHDFSTLVQCADFLISTSITEGFGFSFLEPWLFGKLLWGRKLADICADFEHSGIRLEHLYEGLYVPVDWIGLHQFRDKWSASVLKACRLFNVSIEKACIRHSFEAVTRDGNIDFGLLDESSQKEVLLQVISSRRDAQRLVTINPFLANPAAVADKDGLIENNRRAILRNYNPTAYGEKLIEVYRKVNTTRIRQKIDKAVLVSSFLNPQKFSLLKWSDYVE
jgi:glycosyltransferase involved in cell wall biosynthesis